MRWIGWLGMLLSLSALSTGLLKYTRYVQSVDLKTHMMTGLIGGGGSALLFLVAWNGLSRMPRSKVRQAREHLDRVQRIVLFGWVFPALTVTLGATLLRQELVHTFHLLAGLGTVAFQGVAGYELFALPASLKHAESLGGESSEEVNP